MFQKKRKLEIQFSLDYFKPHHKAIFINIPVTKYRKGKDEDTKNGCVLDVGNGTFARKFQVVVFLENEKVIFKTGDLDNEILKITEKDEALFKNVRYKNGTKNIDFVDARNFKDLFFSGKYLDLIGYVVRVTEIPRSEAFIFIGYDEDTINTYTNTQRESFDADGFVGTGRLFRVIINENSKDLKDEKSQIEKGWTKIENFEFDEKQVAIGTKRNNVEHLEDNNILVIRKKIELLKNAMKNEFFFEMLLKEMGKSQKEIEEITQNCDLQNEKENVIAEKLKIFEEANLELKSQDINFILNETKTQNLKTEDKIEQKVENKEKEIDLNASASDSQQTPEKKVEKAKIKTENVKVKTEVNQVNKLENPIFEKKENLDNSVHPNQNETNGNVTMMEIEECQNVKSEAQTLKSSTPPISKQPNDSLKRQNSLNNDDIEDVIKSMDLEYLRVEQEKNKKPNLIKTKSEKIEKKKSIEKTHSLPEIQKSVTDLHASVQVKDEKKLKTRHPSSGAFKMKELFDSSKKVTRKSDDEILREKEKKSRKWLLDDMNHQEEELNTQDLYVVNKQKSPLTIDDILNAGKSQIAASDLLYSQINEEKKEEKNSEFRKRKGFEIGLRKKEVFGKEIDIEGFLQGRVKSGDGVELVENERIVLSIKIKKVEWNESCQNLEEVVGSKMIVDCLNTKSEKFKIVFCGTLIVCHVFI
ncbi:DNA double-strand break repair Rad50 ATPase, putative [Entamoeba invadens IP1]|uniref:DNA double-strand break repair Rad50 ATPase, putative n=1 Tax=Entamoeba invadens IP1 TaxID=370355 RepID=A0A0A1UH66_ENTIV|nr:DNA double-strand break repair Rad50 ATPase, putative [Entamoeba invadens IP1]ELP94787.1 DNA double-strand break repair Rad50 ATPase, putative [Entamoeba invadens IP1]|eukprot:XP_004261558.1 DNA double-strand break repair Rad50 ATPase, putative [Entamoeba invadens IP1]